MASSRRLVTLLAVAAAVLVVSAVATAARPGFVFPGGCCFYDGDTVRTVVPPSAFPNEGTDPFYGITNGVSGQKAVVGLAPGDAGYNGGHWAFHSVTWNDDPYLLTSESAILAAAAAGDVTITRVAENDFLCPIQK
ncbi:MAG: hypothetical protein HW413_1184 [Thermoleophilia bacterium]|nr:hypothetical protein [Thermoleophilia bacterium]